MVEITAALVKELRENTGAGMMDCKKALTETGGDMEAAVDWLRTKGLAAAAKKAGRLAAEGLVGVITRETSGAVIEVNSETDFVARNEAFQDFVEALTEVALEAGGDLEAIKAAGYPGSGRTVAEELTHMIAAVGENLAIRRAAALKVDKGLVAGYVHNRLRPGLGKIGVVVGLESEASPDRLAELGKRLAMHIAAASPRFLDAASVAPAAIEHERKVLTDQARESGRPENVIEKMVDGRLRKFYEEVALLDQVYVIDGKTKVAKAIEDAAAEMGAPVRVTGFHRFRIGEGIEREEKDFAAEVAAQLA